MVEGVTERETEQRKQGFIKVRVSSKTLLALTSRTYSNWTLPFRSNTIVFQLNGL